MITAPGIAATPAEHQADERGHWAGNQELPVLVDRADPSRFAILWDEVRPVSWQDRERLAAQQEADRINAGGPPGAPPVSPATFSSFDVTIPATGKSPAELQQMLHEQMLRAAEHAHMSAQATEHMEEMVRQALGGLAGTFGQAPGGSTAGPPPYGGFTPAEAARAVTSHSGERATAIVLAARDTPAQGPVVPPGGAADLTLEVTRADGSMYTTHTVIAFSTPERRAQVATVGKHLNVLIDPNDPAKVAVDPAGLF